MPLAFTTSNQHTEIGGVKCCLYSLSGIGKTVLTATAPKPILLAAEAGLLSLRRSNLERLFGKDNPGITYDMPVLLIQTVQDLNDALEFITVNPHGKVFKTICMDSLSEIAEVVLNNAKRQVKDPRQAYGELIEKMESLVRAYVNVPDRHVVMICKQEPFKDELTGIVKYGPSMPGAKLSVKLPYMFDEVFRMGVNKTPQGQEYRFLQTQPDLQYEAKDRSGALAALEPPNLTHVFNKILGVS